MNNCDYYKNYRGPNLISVLVNNIENNDLYNKISVENCIRVETY